MNQNKQIIFISGRFRSGTSMLWNLFNQLPHTTCWYEPLHPNLISHVEYVKPKQDHLGIDDYWQNYRKLNNLETKHSHKFGQQYIYLEKDTKWPELNEYIEFLIQNSDTNTVVLQFNRVDLRLTWLKNNFPFAKIVHIQRQPRCLWKSSRKHLKDSDKHNESHPDAYDLMQWSADLASTFPMLAPVKSRSSYFRHYFIWKLAQRLANSSADLNLSLENDFLNSRTGLDKLAQAFQWKQEFKTLAATAIQQPEASISNKEDNDIFEEIETEVNLIFKNLGLDSLFPSSILEVIKLEKAEQWKLLDFNQQGLTQELLDALKHQKDEITALNNLN
jgi:hypothetical protein